MASVRLLDTPADYQRLGVTTTQLGTWDDRRRNWHQEPGNWEWWYFDSVLDDGTKAVIQFFIRPGKSIKKHGDHPSLTIKVTTPDGKLHQEDVSVKVADCTFGKDQCDVHLGDNSFVGDLKQYRIHVAPVNGLGADLTLTSRTTPYRPGSGYHDHQWGNHFYMTEWNNWLWARQRFDDYTVLLFDLIAAEKDGYQRFPIMFIEDAAGKLVFENRQAVKCTVSGFYQDELSGKDYPKALRYELESDGKQVTYSLAEEEILDAQGIKKIPFIFKQVARHNGVGNLSYSRYYGTGTLRIDDGDQVVERQGKLIYEFMFPGESCRQVLDTDHN